MRPRSLVGGVWKQAEPWGRGKLSPSPFAALILSSPQSSPEPASAWLLFQSELLALLAEMAAPVLRDVRKLLKLVDFTPVPRRHRYKKKWVRSDIRGRLIQPLRFRSLTVAFETFTPGTVTFSELLLTPLPALLLTRSLLFLLHKQPPDSAPLC